MALIGKMANTGKKFTIQNLRSASGSAPTAGNLLDGEIAIGMKKGSEAIYFKNDNNEVVEIRPGGGTGEEVVTASMVETTWAELKELRDNGELAPSTWYRITDFVTTVANDDEARSAGHPFDVIALATGTDVLQEECYAARHEGDTYFGDSRLEAWKVWYCIDNDTTRFQWADTSNGKGVIYRMIDEWNNDGPYDFKNVQFKRYKVSDNTDDGILTSLDGTYVGYNNDMRGLRIANYDTYIWSYTFSISDRMDKNYIDASLIGFNNESVGEGYGSKGFYGQNIIKPVTCRITIDTEIFTPFTLNNIVLITNNSFFYHSLISDNIIDAECCNMTLCGNGNRICYETSNVIMGDGCFNNVIGYSCDGITIGDKCEHNNFGSHCGGMLFGDENQYNTFSNKCGSITLVRGCTHNNFGDDCGIIELGSYCGGNTFGNTCSNISFADHCTDNTLDTLVKSISIKTEYVSKTRILSGVMGNNYEKLEIDFVPNARYSQFAGFDSSYTGTEINKHLRIWNDADNVIDGGIY